jgi:DNA (cytosine-5)-methyltransferase 1
MIWYGKRFARQPNREALSRNCPSVEPFSHLTDANGLKLDKSFCEFFAGIGLMRMALEKEGWNVAFANDIAPAKKEMYEGNFGDSGPEFVLGDIHEIPAESVPRATLATASFPCTDLSLAGGRKGLGGKESSAYWGFVDILREMGTRRPPLVLLENVTGFLTSHGGRDFEAALLALNELGYDVDAMVIDAAFFVPQSRVRLFVVGCHHHYLDRAGVREDTGFLEAQVRPRALAEFIFTHPNIGWMLRDLPPLPERQLQLADIIENLPASSEFWWTDRRKDYLFRQMSQKHADLLARMKAMRKWSYGTVFRRVRNGRSMAELRVDGIAGCLRTPKGGSARQILVKAGYGEVHVRLLTPRECASLMGAGEFRITTGLNQALFGFGDAVCVPAVSWIARHYLNPLYEEIREQAASRDCYQILA